MFHGSLELAPLLTKPRIPISDGSRAETQRTGKNFSQRGFRH